MAKYALASRLLSFAVVAVLFLQLSQSLASPSPAAEQSTSGAPDGLTCEAMAEPLGIDATQPRLSWRLNDARLGALQRAYEVRVATSLEKLNQAQPDIWDTGKVESNDSVNVAYSGPALVSRQRYYWQVRAWDADGKPSDYSKPSWWEMGLLSPQDWKAQWITRDLPVERRDYDSNPKWIWAVTEDALSKATPGKREFRLDFMLRNRKTPFS
jgi:alpha-L-rhamnosidase